MLALDSRQSDLTQKGARRALRRERRARLRALVLSQGAAYVARALLRAAKRVFDEPLFPTGWLRDGALSASAAFLGLATFSALLSLGGPSHAQLHDKAVALAPVVVTATLLKPPNTIPASHVAVAHYIAERFKVSLKTAKTITQEAYRAAKRNKLKPAVILAVAAVESSYHPKVVNAASGARGLMQILPRWHQSQIQKVGGVKALLRIRPNIDVGAEILATYLHRSGGRLTQALSTYCGHVAYRTYAKRVELQLARIRNVIRHATFKQHLLMLQHSR